MIDLLGPFFLIALFSVGILIGATIFPIRWLKIGSVLQTAGIALLLFSMGVSMGGSPTFLQDIKDAGLQALVYAVFAIAGSVFLVWLFSCFAFKKGDEDK